jgi:hypothetical protein
MLLLTILFAWLLVSLTIVALCTAARIGDLQSLDIDTDLDPIVGHDSGVLAQLVRFDSSGGQSSSDTAETQAA